MIKKESIITKTNGTFRMSAIKYTYGLYKNNTLSYWKGVFRQGYRITRRYWHHYRVRALYLQARGIRDRLCIVHCCQSIRGERERAPNGSSCWGVRGNTSSRFTSPGNSRWHDPYAEPPSVLHHTYPMSIPCTVSVCGGNKSQNWSTELETSLLCSTKYEIEIACIISLHFEGLCRQLTVAEISDIFCMHRGCERTLQEHNRYMAHIEMANVKAHRHDSYTGSPDTPWMCESSAQAHFWQAYVLSQARLVNAPVCLKLIRN